MNLTDLHQLQKRKKRHHDLRLVRLPFEHSPEREFAVQPGITQNRGDLVLQTHRFSRNITEPAPHRVDPVLCPFHHGLENLLKLCQRQAIQVHRRLILRHLRRHRRPLKKQAVRADLLLLQFKRHVFVILIFQKTRHQFSPRIFLLAVLIHFSRQEHAGFDVDERRRHHQEFTDNVQILRLHVTYVIEILLRNRHNRNVINIQFILFNQMEQQVQRTLKILQLIGYSHSFLPASESKRYRLVYQIHRLL